MECVLLKNNRKMVSMERLGMKTTRCVLIPKRLAGKNILVKKQFSEHTEQFHCHKSYCMDDLVYGRKKCNVFNDLKLDIQYMHISSQWDILEDILVGDLLLSLVA